MSRTIPETVAKPADIEVLARPYWTIRDNVPGKELVGFKPLTEVGRSWVATKIDRGKGAFWDNQICWCPTHDASGKLDRRMKLHPWRRGVRAFVGDTPYPSDKPRRELLSETERCRSYPLTSDEERGNG
ncbi:hypothetical protein [Bosea sp. (in: a-proteobacteria)]